MTAYVKYSEDPESSSNPATREVVTQDHYHNPLEGGRGDYGIDDIEIPRLDVVHNVGDLSSKFTPGELVLMREFVLPQPVRLTVFGHTKYYVQNSEYEEGTRKQEFDTWEQILSSGGNLLRNKKAGEDNYNFLPAARLYLAIELPPELVETVPGVMETEGRFIARAIWKVQKIAYSQIVRRINLVEAPLRLKNQFISSKTFDLRVERQKYGKHWVQVPDMKVVGNNSEEYVTFLRKVF